MLNWLYIFTGQRSMQESAERSELRNLRKEVSKLKRKYKAEDEEMRIHSEDEEDVDDEEQDQVEKMLLERQAKLKNKPGRSSVSAEVYGLFNPKGDFVAKVVNKSDDQKKRIVDKITQSFLFNSLEEMDMNTVINAMEEAIFKAGENVIQQGENGDVLYVIEKGTLDCFKVFV